jgi:hypothetical protein
VNFSFPLSHSPCPRSLPAAEERERVAKAMGVSGRRREAPRSDRVEEASILGTGNRWSSGGVDEHHSNDNI